MKDEQKEQITNIVNAFKLLNKDIRESFKIMCDELERSKGFEKKWKKNEDGNKNYTSFFDGNNDWYYLNCYGVYNQNVIGFTFIISINYDEKGDTEYSEFIDNLDKNINKNTPMLCIFGIYEPIHQDNIKLLGNYDLHYVDAILQFTDDWKNYEKEKIKYDEWLKVEVNYQNDNKIKNGYEGWYKKAKVKIKHITDISSKEEAHRIINELINCKF
ncbi:hypothetical protein [Sulfuricurvum sp.]|uniref:hypothetical protein n=1 Tax=Sulfuricurvum sp. TaxID=2025608 RepID=UPI003BB4FEB1